VINQKGSARDNLKGIGTLYSCSKCMRHQTRSYISPEYKKQPLDLSVFAGCQKCEKTFGTTGPLWLGDLNDGEFVSECLQIVEATGQTAEQSNGSAEHSEAVKRLVLDDVQQLKALFSAIVREQGVFEEYIPLWDLTPIMSALRSECPSHGKILYVRE
jgi:tRNA G26 N,N-dimethylase Trm1